MTRQALVLALVLGVVACSDDVVVDVDLGVTTDASVGDAGLHDAGQLDMGTDAGPVDAGPVPDIVVAPESGLSTSEAGTSASFTVVLTTQPIDIVVLEIASSDVGEVAVSTNSLTFTTANWNTPQAVTVVGVDDSEADGAQDFGVLVRVTESSDPDYAAIEDKHVTGTNADDDSP